MEILIAVSIGIGLFISLLFSEILGLAAGGMIVPGYLAIYWDKPVMILSTILAAFVTYLLIQGLGNSMILFGRRRTVMCILIGYVIGFLFSNIQLYPVSGISLEFSIVGYIIPGLIAIWMDRQGWFETVTTLMTASVLVRLILILITNGEMSL